jgi:hypothetical protein
MSKGEKPVVREASAAESGRVTNVDPLPEETLRRTYAEPDDAEEVASIAMMMAAQAKIAEE